MSLFQRGHFVFSSGRESDVKVEIDEASDEDIEVLALLGVKRLGGFSAVCPVPKGKSGSLTDNAERIAKVLRPLANPDNEFLPILVVDDVFTTGESIMKMKQLVEREGRQAAMGLVLFAWAKPPPWVNAVWVLGV